MTSYQVHSCVQLVVAGQGIRQDLVERGPLDHGHVLWLTDAPE